MVETFAIHLVRARSEDGLGAEDAAWVDLGLFLHFHLNV